MESKIELLEKLAELRAHGILTDEEFQQQKSEVLARDFSSSADGSEPRPTSRGELTADFSKVDRAEEIHCADDRDAGNGEIRFRERLSGKAVEIFGGILGISLFIAGASYLDFGPLALVRWEFMSDEQLKRELLRSSAETGQKFYDCLQADGDCDAAFEATKETYTLADRLCEKNPTGNACALKDMAARQQHAIKAVESITGELQQSVEDTMLNSL